MNILLELRWHGRMLCALAYDGPVWALWLRDSETTVNLVAVAESLRGLVKNLSLEGFSLTQKRLAPKL